MPLPLSAHHGGAAYDVGKPLTLKGTVTQWYYSNPHCLLTFEVKGENGTVSHLDGRDAGAEHHVSRRLSPGLVQARGRGDHHLDPAKNGRPVGHIREAVTAAGWTLGGGGQSIAKPPGK